MADKRHAFDHGGSDVVIDVTFRTNGPGEAISHTVGYTIDAGTLYEQAGIISKNLPSYLSALETRIKAGIDGALEPDLSAQILPLGYIDV